MSRVPQLWSEQPADFGKVLTALEGVVVGLSVATLALGLIAYLVL